MRVMIGFDEREQAAVDVAVKTLRKVSGIDAELLHADRLRDAGLLSRIADHRTGQDYDLISNAKKSTRFAFSRFLTPILCQSGWALFCDADVVFIRDPREMLDEIKPGAAVYVVKHNYAPTEQWKMVNQVNEPYPRKAWSSVMLFAVDHPANRRLSLHDINTRPGLYLHQFGWLHDDEIGSLDPAWNWLVDCAPKPDNVGIAHLTLGGGWLSGWKGGSFDAEWLAAAEAP